MRERNSPFSLLATLVLLFAFFDEDASGTVANSGIPTAGVFASLLPLLFDDAGVDFSALSEGDGGSLICFLSDRLAAAVDDTGEVNDACPDLARDAAPVGGGFLHGGISECSREEA